MSAPRRGIFRDCLHLPCEQTASVGSCLLARLVSLVDSYPPPPSRFCLPPLHQPIPWHRHPLVSISPSPSSGKSLHHTFSIIREVNHVSSNPGQLGTISVTYKSEFSNLHIWKYCIYDCLCDVINLHCSLFYPFALPSHFSECPQYLFYVHSGTPAVVASGLTLLVYLYSWV